MPEHIRAFIVVFVLGAVALTIFQRAAAPALEGAVLRRWRMDWLLFTALAFLSHNFWILCGLVFLIFYFRRLQPAETFALFLLLLFVVPPADLIVPGFGVVNFLFLISYPRLLALALLLPLFLGLLAENRGGKAPRSGADKWLIAYVLLVSILQLRETTFTGTLRNCFYLFMGVFLPYYVASRSLKSLRDFRLVIGAFVAASCVLGMLALFEFARGWNLYAAVVNALGLRWGLNGYLARDGLLRASVSTGQAIVLGYVLAVAFSFYLFLRERVPRNVISWVLGGLLIGGMVASLSRGPWLGAVLMYVCFVMLGQGAMKRLALMGAAGVAGLTVASFFPIGQRLIGLLPFVGEVGAENIDYRQRLIDNSLIVIERNLWFGSPDYLETPEMQSMIQGEGIIDIVNTYLGVALDHGVIGLFLFLMVFLTSTLSVYRRMRNLPADAVEARDLGRALLASMAGVLFIIFTVSSISFIPLVYWALAGMCAAYSSRLQIAPSVLAGHRRRHAVD